MAGHSLFRHLLLLQIFLGLYSYGQQHSKDTLFEKFRNDILIEQKEYGRVKWDDETSESYYLLLSTHSIEALVKYTNDSVPAVRAQLFTGLAYKKADTSLLREILNKHINDTATFASGTTDVVITWSVGEYMKIITGNRTSNELAGIDYYKWRYEKIRRERYIVIAGVHHGIIPKDSLLQVDSLTCSIEGCKVVSFLLTIRGETIKSMNGLTEQMKDKIRKLNSGEGVYFEAIKIQGRDKTTRTMEPIILKIE